MKLESEIFGKETTLCLAKKHNWKSSQIIQQTFGLFTAFYYELLLWCKPQNIYTLQLLAPDDFLPERSPRISTIGGNKYKVDLSSREVKE